MSHHTKTLCVLQIPGSDVNILYLSDVYFPRINGVSTSIKTFREKLIEQGHRVILVTPEYTQPYEDDEDIIRIPARTVVFDNEDRLMSLGEVKSLAKKLATEKIDLIHIQTPFVAHYAGKYLSQALNIPCIETYHTFFEEYFYNYIPFLPRAILRSLARTFSKKQCNAVEHLIVPSSAMKNVLQGYGIDTDMTILPTGINPSALDSGDGHLFKQRYEIDPERPILMHVGRIAHEKNIQFLLKMLTFVWQEIPEV